MHGETLIEASSVNEIIPSNCDRLAFYVLETENKCANFHRCDRKYQIMNLFFSFK